MTTKSWSTRWLFAGCVASVLLALLALMSRGHAPSPLPVTVVSLPVAPTPVATAPAPARTTPPSRVEPVACGRTTSCRPRASKLRAAPWCASAGVVTGELSIIAQWAPHWMTGSSKHCAPQMFASAHLRRLAGASQLQSPAGNQLPVGGCRQQPASRRGDRTGDHGRGARLRGVEQSGTSADHAVPDSPRARAV